MRGVRAQEGGDVSRAGQLVEPALFDGLEMTPPDPQTLLDIGQAKTALFALIPQQASNRAARCGLTFNHPPINLIWH